MTGKTQISVVDETKRTLAVTMLSSILDGSWRKYGKNLSAVFERSCDIAFSAGLSFDAIRTDTQEDRIIPRALAIRNWIRRPDCPTWKRASLANANRQPGMKRRPL